MSDLPKEYQDGYTEFMNCKINLSRRPLVPRPETEHWTEQVVNMIGHSMSNHMGVVRVLDIFAGSGCIGVAIASHHSNAHITFVDINPKMIEQIKINCELNSIGSASYILNVGSLFSKIKDKFDFIVANPPYVSLGKGAGGIMDYEPKEALFAGVDGLNTIRPFLAEAREYLNPGGQVWLEFGSDQKEGVTDILRELNYYQDYTCAFHRDQYGEWRYVVISS